MNVPEIPFQSFGKIPRLNRDIIITEKIDGTNAQVYVDDSGNVYAGSRNRWITPESDNFGFAKWVQDNADDLRNLGPGHHYGEWWGSGIQRGYCQTEKHFSLFNVSRWHENGEKFNGRPDCCKVVPYLFTGMFSQEDIVVALNHVAQHTFLTDHLVTDLNGLYPGEGIMIYHTASNSYFKVTCENDDVPKGAVNV